MIEIFNDLMSTFQDARSTSPHYFLSLLLYGCTIIVAIFPFLVSFMYRKKLEFMKIMLFLYTILLPLYAFFAISYILKIEYIYFSSLGYYLAGIIGLFLWTSDCILLRYIILKFKDNEEDKMLEKYKKENQEFFRENSFLRNKISYLDSKIKRLEGR